MGEVWKARDTTLGRDVALKILPDHLALDPDRLARFKREAQILASLNHPNIGTIYGFQEADGIQALVLELVEGATLADRISEGPLPIDEALQIARQIAEALEAAHEKGVVHRDLKPANVKITPDEKVKVLDFGLAKAMEPAGVAPSDLSHSPTLSMMATQAGLILGTAAYMSPEQAKGLPADHRSDVFSFGCVLYEMLTGRQPFQGDTAPNILASVLVREPNLSALPPNLNPRVVELLRRCFEKNPKRRWQAVGDLRAEIEAIAATPLASPASTTTAVEPAPLWRRLALFSAPALLVGTVLAGTVVWSLRPSVSPPTVARFAFTLPEGQAFTNAARQLVAISPDGTQIVYVANQRLYLRSIGDLEARPIVGTEIPQGVLNPVFSPDGQSVVFQSAADQSLKKIAITGGAAVTVSPAGALFGMSWGTDGILFGQGIEGILRVPGNGGKPELLVTVSDGELAHGPQMLPGGESVLFTLVTDTGTQGAARWDAAQVVVHSLKSGERKVLIEGASDARYLPTGLIVYAVGGTLLAAPFDLQRLEVKGGSIPIVEGVRRAGTTGTAQFSFSNSGSLVYIPGLNVLGPTQINLLVLIDRSGGVSPLNLRPAPYQTARVSPDGKRLAFGTDDGKEAIVWIYDLSSASSVRRLTFEGRNRFPIWSSDSQRVAFQSDREGDPGIFWQPADGTGTAQRLTKAEEETPHIPESWSPTTDHFLFSVTKGTSVTLWTFSLQDKKMSPFGGVENSRNVTTPTNAAFSPDGRWVAYTSNENAQTANVYVQPFPATGEKYQIPTDGIVNTNSPVWSADGKELFYIPRQGGLAVISVVTEPAFAFGNPVPVRRPAGFSGASPNGQRGFDITRDGKILGVVEASQAEQDAPTAPQITVVLNWFEELKQRVPIN
jgi:serine/threonine-protein kinase